MTDRSQYTVIIYDMFIYTYGIDWTATKYPFPMLLSRLKIVDTAFCLAVVVFSMTTASQNDSWLRLILVILAIILLAPMLMMVFAFPIMGGWMMGPGYGGQISVWGWGMMLVPLLFVLGLGYILYRALTRENSGNDAALEELRMAYARGDISEEEFESRREQLQSER